VRDERVRDAVRGDGDRAVVADRELDCPRRRRDPASLGDRFDVHASPTFLGFDATERLEQKPQGGKARVRALVAGAE
jgi:hypothetical protein